jgi:hypothetical protein
MISSAAYSSHPFFRFKSEKFEASTSVSETKTVSPIEEKKSINSFESNPHKLTCRWVSTGKAYPKMELQWTVIEPHQDDMELNDELLWLDIVS